MAATKPGRIWRRRERSRSGGGAGWTSGVFAPGGEAFACETVNCAFVLVDDFEPGERAHLREIDSAETHARDEDVDAVAERLILERADGVGDGFGIVRKRPAAFHFGVGFGDGHLERRVRHFGRNKFLSVLGTRLAASGFEALIERRSGKRREQDADGKTRRA